MICKSFHMLCIYRLSVRGDIFSFRYPLRRKYMPYSLRAESYMLVIGRMPKEISLKTCIVYHGKIDVIVGFPGETEADFTELCEFVQWARFDRLGCFAYSAEEDTPAAAFEGQIDEQVKQDRMDILMRTQMNINTARNESRIGSVITVLCEAYDPVNECYYGRSSEDAPDIDGKVFFRYNGEERIMPGSMVKVKVREVVDYDVYGFAMKPENA